LGHALNRLSPKEENKMSDSDAVIDELYRVIESRKGGDPEKSYTAKKFAKGTDHIAKKIGEEATEVAIAAARRDRGEIIAESADLLFHLLILWADQGIRPEEALDALRGRRGVSGLDEKKARKTNA
jgi:phosphoribosyl-ATP pyrophosphohydrolase